MHPTKYVRVCVGLQAKNIYIVMNLTFIFLLSHFKSYYISRLDTLHILTLYKKKIASLVLLQILHMSTFRKSPPTTSLNTKILFMIILIHLHFIISSARKIPRPRQNLESKSNTKMSNAPPEVHNVDKNLLPMLVKGRKAPPSAPSHRGHKVAMFQRPP